MPVYNSTFRKSCKIFITSCPDPIIESRVNDVIRDFAEKTLAYRYTTSIDITGTGDGNTLNTHPSFEAVDWVSYMNKSANTAIARVGTYQRTGTYAFRFTTLIDNNNMSCSYLDPTSPIILEKDATYELKGYNLAQWGTAAVGTVKMSAGFGTNEYFTNIVVPSTSYQELSIQFVATETGSGSGWAIWYYWTGAYLSPSSHIHFDDVTLQKVEFPRSYLIDANMIPIVIHSAKVQGETDYLVETSEQELDRLNPNWRDEEDNKPIAYYLDSNNQLALFPKPSTLISVDLDLSVKPKQTATDYIDVMYDDFEDAIRAGVLADLYAMPDKPWTNFEMFKLWSYRYSQAISSTRVKMIKGRGKRGSQVKPVPFGNVITQNDRYIDSSWDWR